MNPPENGQLIPVGGGDTIPLVREKLTIGRRESCDICLRYGNISGQHCELVFTEGLWHIHDLGSTNGTLVNGFQVSQRVLQPGDEICIARRRFVIQYNLPEGHKVFQHLVEEDINSQSLLEKAGLVHPPRDKERPLRAPRVHRPADQENFDLTP